MQVVPPLLVKVLPIELHRGFARFHLALSQGHATENYCRAQLLCIKVSLLQGVLDLGTTGENKIFGVVGWRVQEMRPGKCWAPQWVTARVHKDVTRNV